MSGSTRWRDEDEARYREEIRILSNRFGHVERRAFGPGGAVLGRGRAVRVSITRPDGTEVQEVVHTDQAAEEHIAKLETKIGAIFAKAPRGGGLARRTGGVPQENPGRRRSRGLSRGGRPHARRSLPFP